MTPKEFFESLTKITAPCKLQIDVNQISFQVDEADAIAGHLLNWLYTTFPNITQGELFDALDSAKFWNMFFVGQPHETEVTIGEPE
jgi:hypothetical protein